MSESIENITFHCDEHGPKPNPELHKENPEFYIKKHVKIAFQIWDHIHDRYSNEHMWVRVEGTKDGKLVGTLANMPIFICKYSYGDEVEFEIKEIEEIYITNKA